MWLKHKIIAKHVSVDAFVWKIEKYIKIYIKITANPITQT